MLTYWIVGGIALLLAEIVVPGMVLGFLGAAVHRVVAEHEGVEGAIAGSELLEVSLERGPIVRAQHQVSDLALLLQREGRVDQARPGRLVPHSQQQEVEVVDVGPSQGDLYGRPHQRGDA